MANNGSINPMNSIMPINQEIYFSSLKLYILLEFHRGKQSGFLLGECGYNFNFFHKNIIPKSKNYLDINLFILTSSISKLNLIQVVLKSFLDIVEHYSPLIEMANKNTRILSTEESQKNIVKNN